MGARSHSERELEKYILVNCSHGPHSPVSWSAFGFLPFPEPALFSRRMGWTQWWELPCNLHKAQVWTAYALTRAVSKSFKPEDCPAPCPPYVSWGKIIYAILCTRGCKWGGRGVHCLSRVVPGLLLGPDFSAEVCHHPLMECNPRIWFKSQMIICACLCVCEMRLQCMFPLPSQENDHTPLFGNKASQDFFLELLSLRSCPPTSSKSLKITHFQVCQSVDLIISQYQF